MCFQPLDKRQLGTMISERKEINQSNTHTNSLLEEFLSHKTGEETQREPFQESR